MAASTVERRSATIYQDDIESLRLAALASIKPKADQEPQGIQVVQSIQSGADPLESSRVKEEEVDPDFAELHTVLFQQHSQFPQHHPHFQQPQFLPQPTEFQPHRFSVPNQHGVPPLQHGIPPPRHGIVPHQHGIPPPKHGIPPHPQPGFPPPQQPRIPSLIPSQRPGFPPHQQHGIAPLIHSQPPGFPPSPFPPQQGIPPLIPTQQSGFPPPQFPSQQSGIPPLISSQPGLQPQPLMPSQPQFPNVPFSSAEHPVFTPRGRGNFRGRGFQRGRGRGMNTFQPDMNSFTSPLDAKSAVIVIQTEVPQEEKKQKQESRPVFLRPQDTWGMTNIGSPSSPKQKDTSKFSRYDDDTDSDEDFESTVHEQPEDADEDIEDNRNVSLTSDTGDLVEDEGGEENKNGDDNESEGTDVQDEGHDEGPNNELEQSLHDTSVDVSRNSDIDEDMNMASASISDQVNQDTRRVTVLSGAVRDTNGLSASEKCDDVAAEQLPSNKTETSAEIKLEQTQVCDETDRNSDLDELPKSEHVAAEIKQEDSVSNSYNTFSRFNRRRKKSDSAEESDSDNDDDDNSKDSSWSVRSKPKFQIGSDISSDSELGIENKDELTEEIPGKLSTAVEQTKNSRAKSKSMSKSPSPPRSRSASSSSSSSSSSSQSSSSSSSSSSAKSGSSVTKQATVKIKQEQDHTSVSMPKDVSPKITHRQSVKNERSEKNNDFRPKSRERNSDSSARRKDRLDNKQYHSIRDHSPHNEKRKHRDRSVSPRKTSYTSSRRSPSHRHTSKRSRTPSRKSRRYSVSPARSKTNIVAADPEFDAANYTADGVFTKEKTNKPTRDSKVKQEKIVRDEPVLEHPRHKSDKVSNKQNSRSAREKDTRHFKEVTKLKYEGKKDTKKSDFSDNDIKVKSSKSDSYTGKKHVREGTTIKEKSAHTSHSYSSHEKFSERKQKSRSRSPEMDRKQSKRSKSKSPVSGKSRLKTSEKYSNSRQDKVGYVSNDPKTSKIRSESGRSKDRQEQSKISVDKQGLKSKRSKEDDNVKKEKRRSIEEKLKKIANLRSSSESDLDSEKSVSSLSDISSDSESETWRNKKVGVSRNQDDIVRERHRRKILEREKRRKSLRDKEMDEKGDRDRLKIRDREIDKTDRGHESRRKSFGDKRQNKDSSAVKERQYSNKNEMYEEETKRKPLFEEFSSDSDTEKGKYRSVSSVVKPNIPSLLDIKVSHSNVNKLKNTGRNERLVIQVEQSSGEESDYERREGKDRKVSKRDKRKRSFTSSDDDNRNWSRKHVVSVTYNQETGSDSGNPQKSVYERLGIQVSSKSSDYTRRSIEVKSKSHRDGSSHSRGKRDSSRDNKKRRTDTKKHKTDTQEDDEALNKRIRQIQEKNAEILRRKQEVEQDKQKYG